MSQFRERILSALIQEQVPDYVKSEQALFVEFLKGYYEFLEQSGQAVDASRNLLTYQNIDDTLEEYIEYFFFEVAPSIPTETASENRFFIKKVRELYENKSTVESLKYFFRILFNEEIDVTTPSDNMLRTSDGRWSVDTVMRVQSFDAVFEATGSTIRGSFSNTSATIESVLKERVASITVADLFLSNLTGEFVDLDTISGTFANGDSFTLSPFDIVTDVNVVDGGSGYTIGDTVVISDPTGQDALASVKSTYSNTAIKKVSLDAFGILYTESANASAPAGSNLASFTVDTGIVANTEGRFIGSKGLLSSDMVIQDSRFFQIFSFVIRSGIVVNDYRRLVKDILQPAGVALFGQVVLTSTQNAQVSVGTNAQSEIDISSILDLQSTVETFFKQILVITDVAKGLTVQTTSQLLQKLKIDANAERTPNLDFSIDEEEDLELVVEREIYGTAGLMEDYFGFTLDELQEFPLYYYGSTSTDGGNAIDSASTVIIPRFLEGSSNVEFESTLSVLSFEVEELDLTIETETARELTFNLLGDLPELDVEDASFVRSTTERVVSANSDKLGTITEVQFGGSVDTNLTVDLTITPERESIRLAIDVSSFTERDTFINFVDTQSISTESTVQPTTKLSFSSLANVEIGATQSDKVFTFLSSSENSEALANTLLQELANFPLFNFTTATEFDTAPLIIKQDLRADLPQTTGTSLSQFDFTLPTVELSLTTVESDIQFAKVSVAGLLTDIANATFEEVGNTQLSAYSTGASVGGSQVYSGTSNVEVATDVNRTEI